MLATTPRMVRKTSLQHSMYTPARCSAISFGLIMKQCTKPYPIWTWMDFSHHTSAFCILPHAIIAHVVEGEEQATCYTCASLLPTSLCPRSCSTSSLPNALPPRQGKSLVFRLTIALSAKTKKFAACTTQRNECVHGW